MGILNCLKMIIMTVIGVCISLSCLPIILPIFTFFYIVKMFVRILLKIKYKDKAIIANGADVMFSTVGPKSEVVVNVGFRFVGQMDVPKFRSRVANVLQNSVNQDGQRRYRKMTQTYCHEYGYTLWKDYEDFNIDRHVIAIPLEGLVKKNFEKEVNSKQGPTNFTYVEHLKQLLECNKNTEWKFLMKVILNELGFKTISPEIPQWQVLILEESNERYTMLFRFNHAIADGVYMTRMLCEDFLEGPADLFHNYVPPSRLKVFFLNLWSFSLLPFGIWKMVKNKDKNVLHGTKLSGKKRFYLSNRVELENLRNIRKRNHNDIYSILFSCLSKAMSSHFSRRSTTVKDVTAIIPVPRQNLKKGLKFKNKFALISLKIPTPPQMNALPKGSLNKGCSSLERLRMIKAILAEAKRDPTFIAANSIIVTLCSILPTRITDFLLSVKGVTIDFTNMPGPKSEVQCGNDTIEEIMFWDPDHDPLGIGVSVLSYMDKFRVGLTIDEALLEDETEGDLFIRDFEEEVKNILHELDNPQKTLNGCNLEDSIFLMQYS